MTTTRIGTTRIGRLLRGTTAVGLLLPFLGCAALPRPLQRLAPFDKNSNDELLRQRVEADPFPTAQKAGL